MENVNRRRFMIGLGAGLSATAVREAGFATTEKKKVVVAAHPWVYAATQPEYAIYPILDRIFADMKYAGIEALELIHTALAPDHSVEHIGDLSARHGVPVIGMSYSRRMWKKEETSSILDEAELLIGRLGKVGGRTLGTSVGYKREKKTEAELDTQAEVLRKITAICEANGVVLNLHNHVYEARDNQHDLGGTLKRIPDAKLGPDFNWVLRAGIDPVDFIKQHGHRLVYAHLRDQKAAGKWSEAMGEGVMDYGAIGRALREANFAGDLAIELAHEKEFMPTRLLRESLKMSREYVRREMGY